MVSYLSFESICDELVVPHMGGGALLPPDIPWPKDDSGCPMLHFIVLPPETVASACGVLIPHDHVVSLFVPYSKDSVQYAIDLARKSQVARAVVHRRAGSARQECACALLPAHALQVKVVDDIDDEDEYSDEIDSKLGGTPVWLQDRIDVPDYRFVLQLVGTLIGRFWPSHNGIFLGGICYFFVRADGDVSRQDFGKLRIQYS